ncbi:MAG: hypothetical protein LC104_18900, partial [Bacteroidales bacterium]|nr:hypothetical protein [Bacteroidales bacterium]
MTPENPLPEPRLPGEPTETPDIPVADDAELIAFLDGELDGPEAQAIASQLALDPTVRAKADAYKKTFALLDYLPKPEP